MRTTKRAGFTITDGVLVVSVVSILLSALVPGLSRTTARERDNVRLEHMQTISAALEAHHASLGHYPPARADAWLGGWDASHSADFLTRLMEAGFLEEPLADPINDEVHHYRYVVHQDGNYGCVGEREFFVLGFTAFETRPTLPAEQRHFACPERDFSDELAFSTSTFGQH
jgi:type II secretory pathway pseudopilin PulG